MEKIVSAPSFANKVVQDGTGLQQPGTAGNKATKSGSFLAHIPGKSKQCRSYATLQLAVAIAGN